MSKQQRGPLELEQQLMTGKMYLKNKTERIGGLLAKLNLRNNVQNAARTGRQSSVRDNKNG